MRRSYELASPEDSTGDEAMGKMSGFISLAIIIFSAGIGLNAEDADQLEGDVIRFITDWEDNRES